MKTFTLLLISSFFCFSSIAQNDIPKDQWFGFWVGEWELSWDEQDGKKGKGTNRIERVLDGKVIMENFEALEGQLAGFKGKSMSVYTPQQDKWHQAWADNQGGYFDFYGIKDGNKYMFQTQEFERNGKPFTQRMVFYNITKDAFIWDWENSTDGGKSWNLAWRINYKRKG